MGTDKLGHVIGSRCTDAAMLRLSQGLLSWLATFIQLKDTDQEACGSMGYILTADGLDILIHPYEAAKGK